MGKIVIAESSESFQATWSLAAPGVEPLVFLGTGKTKKACLQSLRKNMNTYMKKIETSRTKVMWAMQEADMIIHTPALLNGEDDGDDSGKY